MLRGTLAFFLPAALAACASAPPESAPVASSARAERPSIKVGDKWTSACTQGRERFEIRDVIASVDDSGIKGTRNGKSLVMTPDLNPFDDGHWSHTENRLFSFPLEVGKKWSFTDHWVDPQINDEGNQKASVTVVSYEKVRVTAGAFEAFRLKYVADWTDKQGYSGTNTSTYWYAPAARAAVRMNLRVAGQPEVSCELTELELQP